MSFALRRAVTVAAVLLLPCIPTAAAAAAESSAAMPDTAKRVQSVGARGTLLCQGRPAANIKVKLFDRDLVLIDDLLSETRTDGQGRFELSGATDEVATINPHFAIYHDCNDGVRPCQRKFSTDIPNAYITNGPTPSMVFDAGTLELEGRRAGETRDCLG
ncbi:transthyretin-like family protein [Streptomyces sp. NPDC002886]|uniref:transthyretin-like family protein n=1 Tax=Streptomyces sp. NPDC002886 TaxID=3364667 RepID=UPI0036988B32